MANSFLDYLADSDEEALGPVPPRKKLASTAPGASRGNAIALPGIVATARSVTRAADRLEKDRTPQPRPGIFDAGAPGPVFGSALTGQVDDMVRQQERAQPRAVPAADDGLTHGVDAESERALRMGERIASAVPSAAQPRFSRFPSAVVGDATRSMLPEVQPSAMVSPRDVATQQAQRLAQARRTADEADRQRVYDALPPQVRVPMNFYERAAQVLPGGQMLAALPQQIGRSLAGDDPFNLPQTEAEQAGIRRSTLDRAAGLAGTFAGYGGMLAAAEGGAGALLPESAGVGARKLVARGAQAAVDASQPAEDARQRAEHVLLGQAMSAAGDLPALARIARGEDAFQRSLIDRRIRSGLEAERASANVFGVDPGTTSLPRREGPSYGVRSPVAQSEPAGEAIASSARSVRTPGPPERIVRAAIRDDNGQVHEGTTHGDAMLGAYERAGADINDSPPDHLAFYEDGFVTDRGRFVSKAEAANLARASGQVGGQLQTAVTPQGDLVEELGSEALHGAPDAASARSAGRAAEEVASPAPRSLVDRLVSPARNETGATGSISALNTSVGEAIRRAPVDSAPRSQWTRYLDDEFDRWLTDGNEGSDIGKAHPDERLWAELDERMNQRFKSNQPVTRRDLLNLLAESQTRGIEGGRGALALPPGSAGDRGAAALRPMTALAGAGLGAAGGAVADPEHPLKGAAEGALLGGIAGTAAPSLLARLARSGESADLPPLPRKGTIIQTWDGRPIEILGRGRRGQVRARWEGREVDLPWASVHKMTLPQPPRRAVPEITDPEIPDVSPGAPAYTETGGLDALARGEDVGERPLLTMRHRYNPDYTATLHLEHAGDRPRFVVREHGGTSPRVLDFDTEEQATTAARTMGFATEGPTDAPLPGQSAEDFRNQVQASAVAGLRGDRPGGFRTRPPTPAGPAKGAPLPLPPLHPALDPEAVRPVWDTVSGRYPRLASLIRGIGVEARRGVGAGYDGPERALFLRADRDPALHFVFHELAHAAQYARGKLGEFRSDDVGLLTEMEDYAYRMGRAYDAAKGGNPPPGADPIDHLMYRMALGAVGGGVGGAVADREHNRLASGLEGAAAGALLQGAGELVPSAVRAVSNRVGAVGDDITRAMRQEDLPRSLQGGIPRDLRTPPLQRAYLHGISAGESGLAHDFNNFPIGTPEWRAAERGWNATRPRERTVSQTGSAGGGNIGVQMMGGMAGGLGGAAFGATQGDTPAERAANALAFGAAGVAGGAGLGSAYSRVASQAVPEALASAVERNIGTARGQSVRPGETGAIGDPGAFYSRLDRAIGEFPQERGTPQQWAAYLAQRTAKGEREWVGIDGFLRDAAERGEPVTREQVRALYDDNAIRLQEVVRGGPENRYVSSPVGGGAWRVHNPATGHVAEEGLRGVGASDTARRIATRLNQDRGLGPRAPAKFGQYQAPGADADSYREVLVTLPQREGVTDGWSASGVPAEGGGRHVAVRDPQGNNVGAVRDFDGTDEEAIRRFAGTGRFANDGFRSPHWEEPNVLLHLRMNDRTLPNGEKVLFVEELQSDWAQTGRRKGFGRHPLTEEGIPSNWQVRQLPERPDLWGVFPAGSDEPLQVARSREEAVADVRFNKPHEIHRAQEGIPEMPFGRTEEWLGLGMKRVLDEAAAGGYDRVAWTTGAQQAERYDLSKQIAELAHWRDGDRIGISAYDLDHQPVIDAETYRPDELPGLLGKDVADRIVAGEGDEHSAIGMQESPEVRFLRGDDLRVGGEGMRSFYDRMIPNWVKDYGRRLGVKIEVEPLSPSRYEVSHPSFDEPEDFASPDAAQGRAESWEREAGVGASTREIRNPNANPSFRMTPELRERMRQGQPIGAADNRLLRGVAGAGAGGAIGAATDDQNRLRGAATGALAGAGLALAPEAIQSMRRVSGDEIGAIMPNPERLMMDALNRRGTQVSPGDLARLASGDLEPADFAATYGVSPAIARKYADHVRTLSDPEGYRSPLDSDEFTHDRPERESFVYQQPPTPAPIDGVPDDGFLPPDAQPRKYGAGHGQTGMSALGAEGVTTLRRSAMLMNVAGRLRDVVSNMAMGASETSAEAVGTAVDALIDYFPGMHGQRTMAFNAPGVLRAARDGVTVGTGDMVRSMRGRPRLHRSALAAEEAASASVEGAGRVVMSDPILDATVRLTGRFAGSVDSQAAVFAYEKSLAQQARAIAINARKNEGITRLAAAQMENELRTNPSEAMKVLASSAVAHATFTNESVASRILAGMREATFPNAEKGRPDMPWARAGLDFVAPFRRVPGAVAGKTLEYSPLGAVKMTRDAVRLYKLAHAGADPAEIAAARRSFAKATGRVTTGALTIAIGADLASHGLMTGAHLTPEQKTDGARPFSIKIAGRWWPLGMMGPTGAMLTIGAELHNRGAGEAAAALGENVADATLMRGMGDVRAAVSDPSKASRYVASAASSFVPPIVGQVARIIDPVQRKPDGVLQTVEARIPFASRNVPERTDNFGREVRETASLPGRVALALFDGVHSVPSRGGRDSVQDRLTRMGVSVGSVRRKTAETEQEFAERISDYPEAPHREDETDADYRRRAATWNRPRPAETDAEFRQRQRDLGASVHANLRALFARRAPEDEYLNDKWTAYRGAEATVREAHPNLRGPAFQRAVEAERRKVVASLIAGTKHSFAVAGDEDPRTYLSP